MRGRDFGPGKHDVTLQVIDALRIHLTNEGSSTLPSVAALWLLINLAVAALPINCLQSTVNSQQSTINLCVAPLPSINNLTFAPSLFSNQLAHIFSVPGRLSLGVPSTIASQRGRSRDALSVQKQ